MKTCSRCKEDKPLDQYCKSKVAKDGLNPWCLSCRNEYQRSYDKDIVIKERQLRQEALRIEKKEKELARRLKEQSRSTRTTKECPKCKTYKPLHEFNKNASYCKQCSQLTKREWYAKNKEYANACAKEYSRKNSKQISKRITDKRNSCPEYKLASNMRARLKLALRRQRAGKHVSASEGTGCSWDELKAHLESRFQPGMTWENWGRYGWHVDHIRPIDSFDLSDPEQVRIAFHYTNLQPLWARDNLVKSNKLIDEDADGQLV